jgi:hypothetical protein
MDEDTAVLLKRLPDEVADRQVHAKKKITPNPFVAQDTRKPVKDIFSEPVQKLAFPIGKFHFREKRVKNHPFFSRLPKRNSQYCWQPWHSWHP